jgi:hypothetical protein
MGVEPEPEPKSTRTLFVLSMKLRGVKLEMKKGGKKEFEDENVNPLDGSPVKPMNISVFGLPNGLLVPAHTPIAVWFVKSVVFETETKIPIRMSVQLVPHGIFLT